MKNPVKTVSIVLICCLTGCRSGPGDGEIVARVGDAVLTREALARFMTWEGLKPYQENVYVERWINRELLYQEARKKKLDQNDELRWELELIEKEWMIHRLLEHTYREKIQITENEVRTYYDENQEQFRIEEDEVRAFHILTRDRSEANLARQEITAGRQFEEVARERSIGMFRNKGGDMGYVRRGDIIPELSRVLFALSEGALSNVIRSDYGFHLIKAVKKRRQGDIKDLGDVRDDIIQRLRVSRERAVYYDLLFQLQNQTKVEVEIPGAGTALDDTAEYSPRQPF